MQELTEREKKSIMRNKLKFIELAKRINGYLKEDGIGLTFEGYSQTISDYLRVTDTDIEMLGALCLDLNLWADYFGELEGLIELKMLKQENKMLYLEGGFDKNYPDLDLEVKIKEAKSRYSHFKLFLKHIITQKKLFEKSHRHCLREYDKALNNFLYKYND